MSVLAAAIPLSALISWGVAAWVRNCAEASRLVQAPNHRSSHVQPTPNGGGLGIVVAGSFAGIALVLLFGWTLGWFVLGLSALLAAVGLRENLLIDATKSSPGMHETRFTPTELNNFLERHMGTPKYYCHLGLERSFREVLDLWTIFAVVEKPETRAKNRSFLMQRALAMFRGVFGK